MYKYKYNYGYSEATTICDRALTRMPTAKAGVNGNLTTGIVLMSYGTPVIAIDPDGWLTCTGTYSQTTRKHISAFMREYAPHFDYYDAKACYEKYQKLNIYTGKIVAL